MNLIYIPFTAFEAILGGRGRWRLLEGASYTNFPLQRGRLLDIRRLFESGRLLDHLRYFARVGVERYATLKVQKTELFLTMPQPRADRLWQMPHPGKGEVKNARQTIKQEPTLNY